MRPADIQVGAYVTPNDPGRPALYEVEACTTSGSVRLRNCMVPADECIGPEGIYRTTVYQVCRSFDLVVPEPDDLEGLLAA